MMIYKAKNHVRLPRMREISPTPTLVASNKSHFFRIALVYSMSDDFVPVFYAMRMVVLTCVSYLTMLIVAKNFWHCETYFCQHTTIIK
jgi:hypothetical protein